MLDLADSVLGEMAARLLPADLSQLRSCCRSLQHHPGLLERVQRTSFTGSLGRGELMPYVLRLSKLRTLALGSADSVFQLSRLSGLLHLRKVILTEAEYIDVTPLQALHSLKVVSLSGCEHLAGLTGLLQLTKLHLDDCECTSYTALSALQALKLDRLSISLQPLAHLSRLRVCDRIGTYHTQALGVFSGLAQLSALRVLNSAAGPASYPALAGLQQLSELTLSGSEQPPQLTLLSSLTRLRRLALHQAWGLPINNMKCLSKLLLLYNGQPAAQASLSLPQLGACSRLEVLHLRLNIGQASFMVAPDKLPAHKVDIKHTCLTGELYLHAGLQHRVQAVAMEQVSWRKLP